MAEEIIRTFWNVMATNDFARASQKLDPEFEYYMPQSGEYLRGRQDFAALNTAYPAAGPWTFAIRSIIADGLQGVSDVVVSDGDMTARAITFHTIRAVLIWRQVEYWPDPYPAPEWRARWVRIVDQPPF
ncbi:MAG: nuclear transport factor 2 family protein [Pseudomonadota bacterium]